MTYIVPYSFVPGTKAKADEVNADFIYLTNILDDTNERIDDCNTEISALQTNLDKKSSTLNESIAKKANSTDLDGNWVYKYVVLINATNLYNASNSTAGYSLSSYLPSGGNLYEILVRGSILTGNTSGNYAPLYLTTDWSSSYAFSVCSNRTRANATIEACGSCTVLARNRINMFRRSNYTGTATVELLGYRKVR